MALNTSNIYGNITISDDAVAMLIRKIALECYGWWISHPEGCRIACWSCLTVCRSQRA